MFIQTEPLDDSDRMRFLPGCTVLESDASDASGTMSFADSVEAVRSPLARRLFAVDEVRAVELGPDHITVTKAAATDWRVLKPTVLGAVMEHFVSGEPVLLDPAAAPPLGGGAAKEAGEAEEAEEADPAVVAEIRELIETRIRPTAAQGGGDVVFHGYKDGHVLLEMKGPAFQLKAGIENMLRHYVPEIKGVKDYRDALPKPGMNTPEAAAIQELLDTRINPSVAMHGGHIALVDVQEDTVYIRLEGGCQGCGMADVTLKQGIEVQIKQTVPEIRKVLDVTDHASGDNPYYQPAK